MEILLFIILLILVTCDIYYQDKLICKRLLNCCNYTIKIRYETENKSMDNF